jgi:hypothetical protein
MSDPENPTFEKTVLGLLAGDFTRLAPLFKGTESSPCPILQWHAAGRFADEPQALEEAFTCACFNGCVEVAEYLLARGANPSGGAGTGLNAFHWAANRGQLEIVKLLVRHHAPLEIRNSYGGTVLGGTVWAAVHETRDTHPEILETLLKAGAKVGEAEFPSGDPQVDRILQRYGANA